jgi:hypothetical protein
MTRDRNTVIAQRNARLQGLREEARRGLIDMIDVAIERLGDPEGPISYGFQPPENVTPEMVDEQVAELREIGWRVEVLRHGTGAPHSIKIHLE